ncbi:Rpn family recombination-promoting nuclease/putative transposase [Thiocystis violacea]|uniref:Rpn family recombination-promoting nuclease/putative transposase n=1 Tax=Thiocystis violacea TaxID=13725 RepID=UPI00190459DF|nr:Rpn family recombination-promoting nuclease/putative transposase [Thiocystis violacea]MBK1718644.1 transposase [Thiocystis violacea]
MAKPHDTGYKELFSHPEFVQQLIEGFAPPEVAALMDFSTLRNHSGNYITPLFEEKFEDVVWSVEARWQGITQRVFVYLLLEFQSRVDHRMPIRLLHYVACFYDHLLKTKVTTPSRGLPPLLPIVLYNGSKRWTAAEDIYEQVRPEPPAFLRAYQPHLRYYLIDEGRYSSEELAAIDSPLSGVFAVEQASADRLALQAAVERLVRLLRADPNKERLDRLITRWLKRHLQRLGAGIDLERINSLIEDKAMLAENLENWAKRERQEGRQEGRREGRQETARNLLKLGLLSDAQIAQATGLTLDQIQALREADRP